MLYARALLLVRELHQLRRRVLVLINESTFGKEDGELKKSLGSASMFVEIHNKLMTLGGVIVGTVGTTFYYLGIRPTRLEEGLKRLDEKQESERREREANDKTTRAEAESAMLRVFTGNEYHGAVTHALEKAKEKGEAKGEKAMENAMSFRSRAWQYLASNLASTQVSVSAAVALGDNAGHAR